MRGVFAFVGCVDEACDSNGSVFLRASNAERPSFWVERKGSTAAIPERPFKPGVEDVPTGAGEAGEQEPKRSPAI